MSRATANYVPRADVMLIDYRRFHHRIMLKLQSSFLTVQCKLQNGKLYDIKGMSMEENGYRLSVALTVITCLILIVMK